MNKCDKTIKSISAYLDNQLEKEFLKEFDKHINKCTSCKAVLEEIKLQIQLCNDLEEEELPSGFKEELHFKLLQSEKKKNEKKILFFKRNKYTSAFTAIAAILILLIAVKGMYGNLNFGTKSTSNSAARVAAVLPRAAAPAADAAAPAAVAASPDTAPAATAARSAAEESTAPSPKAIAPKQNIKMAKDSASDKIEAGSAVNETGIDTDSSGDKQAVENKADSQPKNSFEKARIISDDVITGFTASTNLSINNANPHVVILVADKSSGIEKIKGYLISAGGAIVEDSSSTFNFNVGSTAENASVSGDTDLDVKVPNSKYEQFETNLKELDSTVSFDTYKTYNINDRLKAIQKNLDEINQKIDSGEVSNQDDLNQLKADRDKLKEELEFTFITISIKKK